MFSTKEFLLAVSITGSIPILGSNILPEDYVDAVSLESVRDMDDLPADEFHAKANKLAVNNLALFAVVTGLGKATSYGAGRIQSHIKFRNTPEYDKIKTARHEAGHALLAALSKYWTVKKATILPDQDTSGHIIPMQYGDGAPTVKQRLLDELAIGYGGRTAEELTLGPAHTDHGAIEDICVLTEIAKTMVFQFGMGEGIPPLFYGEVDYQGRKVSYSFSEATKQKVDDAIMQIAENTHSTARRNLEMHKDKLNALTDALLKRVTLKEKDIYRIAGIDPENPPGLSGIEDLPAEPETKPNAPPGPGNKKD